MRHAPDLSFLLPARPAALLGLLALSAPAFAWVPKLEDTTAKNVIDGAYARRDPVKTFLTVDLNVRDGAFVSGPDAVTAFDGGATCVSDWLATPQMAGKGSRPRTITLSGQADELAFQAQDARNKFQNLSVKDALGPELSKARLADGELRVDIAVSGLPTLQARGAYLVRLRGPDGTLVAPVRSSYVNDWKPVGSAATQPADKSTTPAGTATTPATPTPAPAAPATTAAAQGPFEGTLVYYFQPLKVGIGASDRMDLLLRTEADTNCAYSVPLNLGAFQ
ncbi:hypothetical protein [Deinococcus sp.]|uniref:hypothetical protein n=1 Tax=Deinococcus sp. TaxID=47478 RepID=UPI0028698946|nr:hypothetical protein [Deinococcus sp.]